MLRLLHDQNLIDDQFLARLMRQVHLFDGHLLSGGQRLGNVEHGQKHFTKQSFRKQTLICETKPRTLANLLDLAIQRLRIFLRHDRPQLLHDLHLGHGANPLLLLLGLLQCCSKQLQRYPMAWWLVFDHGLS